MNIIYCFKQVCGVYKNPFLCCYASALKQKYWMTFCQSLYCQPTNVLPPFYVTEDVNLLTKQDLQQDRNLNTLHETIQLLVVGS